MNGEMVLIQKNAAQPTKQRFCIISKKTFTVLGTTNIFLTDYAIKPISAVVLRDSLLTPVRSGLLRHHLKPDDPPRW